MNSAHPFCRLNEKHFTFHLQYEHSGTFANRKYDERSYPINPKMCDPIIVNPVVKMQPHPAAHPHWPLKGSSPPRNNSNLPLTRSNFEFPSDHFQYNFTLDNSNFFLFPVRVRIIGSRL